jgi:cobalt/nickel transport system permease protein
MHIPDGFIDGTTSAGAVAVAAGGLGASLRRAGEVLDERRVPLAGLVAAFVFAVQMLNFPVAGGTSGHLLGGALAAVLVGPAVGAVCVSVVLAVQALLFADGGLSALGLNVLNMALLTAFGGYAVFVVARRLLPRSSSSVVMASGLAAAVSVVVSAMAFTLEYAIGGAGTASVAGVAAAMVGVHVLVGVGEGVITGLVVGAVLATRPDLVWGARDLASDPAPTGSVPERVAS